VRRPRPSCQGVSEIFVLNVLMGFAWALGAVLLFLIVLSVLAFVADRDWSTELIGLGLASVVSATFP
jgi:hypothetical protein